MAVSKLRRSSWLALGCGVSALWAVGCAGSVGTGGDGDGPGGGNSGGDGDGPGGGGNAG